MLSAEIILFNSVQKGLLKLYNINSQSIFFQKTRKEFEGDFTFVSFPFIKEAKRSPEQMGKELGEFLLTNDNQIVAFNVVKGFLNITLCGSWWLNYFNSVKNSASIGFKSPGSLNKTIMVEYSSPNTNKPLHLGHVRNNLLGFSIAKILEACGNNIIKANLVNDRGIHICKSMLAWKKWGNEETPETSGMKGDHLVGKYYVEFDKAYKKQIEELITQGKTKEEAEKQAPLIGECQQMLLKWEAGDKDVVSLWKAMNGWVYDGFAKTYALLGVEFDKMYFESNTYLLGKEIIQEGLGKNVFYKKPNGSVAIDLSNDGLDEKIVLRSDGTSVYITQDIGTAIDRFKEFPQLNQLIYTVGNEQDYHFKVLFKTLEKLGYDWAKECYHLSYGMVELPDGKMKSREGTVVDADELIAEMYKTAETTTRELGKADDFSDEELNELFTTIGMGALKYFILKVDPKKKMLFNPKESIDFNGHTGPFVQYTYARIKSVLRKADVKYDAEQNVEMNALEKELVRSVYDFEAVIEESAKIYNPSIVANYAYELTKTYNRFYHEFSILKEENQNIKIFRIQLSKLCAQTLANAMGLLGIKLPEKM